MKSIQKIILPVLIISAAALLYFTYFSPKEGLGSFSDFDTNNNANKEIRVKVVTEKGINNQEGVITFFAVDNNGTEMMIQAPADIPENIGTAGEVTLRGHLHPDHFHAVDVQL
jgi:hypothetical protein